MSRLTPHPIAHSPSPVFPSKNERPMSLASHPCFGAGSLASATAALGSHVECDAFGEIGRWSL